MIIISLILISLINLGKSQDARGFYKCGVDSSFKYDILEIDPKPIDHNSPYIEED